MGIQAPVVNDLDHGSKTMLLELWCWCAGKRAIAEEEGTVVGFHAARIQGQHVERRSGGVRRGVCEGIYSWAASRIVNGRTRTGVCGHVSLFPGDALGSPTLGIENEPVTLIDEALGSPTTMAAAS